MKRGKRYWRNRDQYYGEFEDGLMHGKEIEDKSYPKINWYFQDMQKGLFYEENLEFEYGQLKKAGKVYQIKFTDQKGKERQMKKTLLGRF